MKSFDNEALRQCLMDSAMSVAECARRLNVPKTTVSGWLNGRHRPAWGNVQRIAAILDVAPDDLLKDVSDFTPGLTGAVELSQAQAIILAVAVALAQHPHPETLVADWLHQLKPAEQELLRRQLVVTPHWAWDKLRRLGAARNPLEDFGIQLRINAPVLHGRFSS